MEDFLIKNKGSFEPGLIITLDDSHTRRVEEWLLSKDFRTDSNLENLVQEFRIGGNFYIASSKIENTLDMFDIVMGFSSRQIKLDDAFISPKYQSINFTLVYSRDFIEKEIQAGRNWVSLAGLSIQAD